MRLPTGALALTVAVALLASGPAGAAVGDVERIAGVDRFATAAAISQDAFADGAETVFVATGVDHPDALAGGPAAASRGAPILLVTRGTVPDATRAELERLDASGVVILGGEAAVSRQVADELAAITGAAPERIAGTDRYATAAAVSEAHFEPDTELVFVATGDDFPDALAAAAAGAAVGAPVLLTRRDTLPDSTFAEIERLGPRTLRILGGTGAVSGAVEAELRERSGATVERIAGADRFATATELSRAMFTSAPTVLLATGAAFADALAGAPAGHPLLLVPRHCVPDATWAELQRLGPDRTVVLGGVGAVGSGVEHLLSCGPPEATVLADGLALPWDITFTPDGRTFVTERDSGRLLERRADGSFTEVQRFTVNAAGEGGLLGLTHSPGYATDGLLYAYLTTATDNRVVRFRPGDQPQTVLTGIPRANIHNGGRVAFGPDGLLYVTTGDAAQTSLSQRRDSLAGKILRMTPEGAPVAGNLDPGSHVYALGIRNSQGLAWDRAGRLFATEFGPDVDDEVNVIVAGGNYGWPHVTGVANDPRFVDPVVVRQPPEASWSGAAILSGGSVPAWEGDLFAAALRGQRLWRFSLDGGRVTGAEQLLLRDYGRLRQVAQAPDGSLWILTSNGSNDRIIRLGPPPHRGVSTSSDY
jgi:glucose/arabinose dehydrogenase/putative cell wall-binding protein